jgi:hypothetical protein
VSEDYAACKTILSCGRSWLEEDPGYRLYMVQNKQLEQERATLEPI